MTRAPTGRAQPTTGRDPTKSFRRSEAKTTVPPGPGGVGRVYAPSRFLSRGRTGVSVVMTQRGSGRKTVSLTMWPMSLLESGWSITSTRPRPFASVYKTAG